MKKEHSGNHLTAKQKKQLERLVALPDEAIDTSDIPEIPDWSNAQRGLFYRPVTANHPAYE